MEERKSVDGGEEGPFCTPRKLSIKVAVHVTNVLRHRLLDGAFFQTPSYCAVVFTCVGQTWRGIRCFLFETDSPQSSPFDLRQRGRRC
jgi:hypothetical protein